MSSSSASPSQRGRSPARPRAPVTLSNFEAAGAPINSPRSIAVCARFGIDPSELAPKTYATFAAEARGAPDAIVRRRFEHAEGKRQQKLALLRSERDEMIAQGDPGLRSTEPATPHRRMDPSSNEVGSPLSVQRQQEHSERLSSIERARAERNTHKMRTLEQKTYESVERRERHADEVAMSPRRHNTERVPSAKTAAERIAAERKAAKAQHVAEVDRKAHDALGRKDEHYDAVAASPRAHGEKVAMTHEQAERIAQQRRMEKAAHVDDVERRTEESYIRRDAHREATVSPARAHQQRVVETHARAGEITETRKADAMLRVSGRDHERTIRAADAQLNKFQSAAERGAQHDDAIAESQRRAAANEQAHRQHHEHHVQTHEQTAAECEERNRLLMAMRTQHGMQHDDEVRQKHDRAQELAAAEKARRAMHVGKKAATVEQRVTSQRHALATEAQRKGAAHADRVDHASRTARTLEQQRRDRARMAQSAQQQAFHDRMLQNAEERMWEDEIRREQFVDRVEEVRRVRRAREHERKERLVTKQIAHGCVEVSNPSSPRTPRANGASF